MADISLFMSPAHIFLEQHRVLEGELNSQEYRTTSASARLYIQSDLIGTVQYLGGSCDSKTIRFS